MAIFSYILIHSHNVSNVEPNQYLGGCPPLNVRFNNGYGVSCDGLCLLIINLKTDFQFIAFVIFTYVKTPLRNVLIPPLFAVYVLISKICITKQLSSPK